jgi:hypothetical protein
MKTSIKWMIDYLVDITTIGTPKITGYEKWLFNIKYINKTIQKFHEVPSTLQSSSDLVICYSSVNQKEDEVQLVQQPSLYSIGIMK